MAKTTINYRLDKEARRQKVYALRLQGRGKKSIADELGVSKPTVSEDCKLLGVDGDFALEQGVKLGGKNGKEEEIPDIPNAQVDISDLPELVDNALVGVEMKKTMIALLRDMRSRSKTASDSAKIYTMVFRKDDR